MRKIAYFLFAGLFPVLLGTSVLFICNYLGIPDEVAIFVSGFLAAMVLVFLLSKALIKPQNSS